MTMVSPDDGRPSISRTARYKKVTKPLLERKRRARINRCLEELKDLMVGAFEVEGENVSKLEKADILELTVRHLTKLHSPSDPVADAMRFKAGFGQCAAEACQFILSMPGIDSQVSQNLIKHLTSQIGKVPLDATVPSNSLSPVPSEPRNNPRVYRQDLPQIPIDQPLVCDTTSMQSVPDYDPAKPMTGLLMTYNNYFPSNEDAKRKQEATEKQKIMQKIRDQILGRQVDRTRDEDRPDYGNQYQNPYFRAERHYEEPRPSTADLRKKSKGEIKHYPSYDPTHQDVHPVNYSMNKKPETYAPSESFFNEDAYLSRRRNADYRNIHPKKVLIRPILEAKDRVESVNPQSNEPINYSPLRQQRPTCSRNESNHRSPQNVENEEEENMWRPW